MSERIRVVVTQRDIDKAEAERRGALLRSESCPIAQSLRRRWPDASVGVQTATLDMGGDDPGATWWLPDIAREAIIDFDARRHPVRPFIFTMTDHT